MPKVDTKTKHLILFWGWNRGDTSYQGLIEKAPAGWKIWSIAYPDLIPNGEIQKLGEYVVTFLKEHNISNCYLLGHSLGGGLALYFASEYPKLVKHLYLVDSVGLPAKGSVMKDIFHAWRKDSRYKNIKAESRINLMKRIIQNPFTSFRLGILARTLNLEEHAKKIKIPTTLIWGSRDRLIPIEKGEHMHNLIEGSKLIKLKDMSHDWILYYPKYFWKYV